MNSSPSCVAYLLTLQQARVVTPNNVKKFVSAFPTYGVLAQATPTEISDVLGADVSDRVVSLRAKWDAAVNSANEAIANHKRAGIDVLAFTDHLYPRLLGLIKDPPPILFVKGRTSILSIPKALAVVGTRDSTPLGGKVARQIARYFAGDGFVIVSGLAKGIDSEAHKGALAADGRTVAVLANPLDRVYPKENKVLADHILNSGGALVSEIPVGEKTFPSAFVQRDRIQSGMSLGIIPVQTDIEGGTMHTVRFAEQQHRLLFCPRPLPEENGQKQYKGVKMLIESGRAKAFGREDYSSVTEGLLQVMQELLGTEKPGGMVEDKPQETIAQKADYDTAFVEEVVLLLTERGVTSKQEFQNLMASVKKKMFPSRTKTTARKKRTDGPRLFSES